MLLIVLIGGLHAASLAEPERQSGRITEIEDEPAVKMPTKSKAKKQEAKKEQSVPVVPVKDETPVAMQARLENEMGVPPGYLGGAGVNKSVK